MATSPDPIAYRKLALSKQLYQHAVNQAARHAVGSRVLAIIAFDLATETLLRTVVTSLAPEKTPADGFAGLLQQAESTLTSAGLGALPDKANILHVHGFRNDAQHKARYPSVSDVSDARTYTRDFLDKLAAIVWGLRFDAITLVDLIQNETVRKYLREAETAFAASDYVHAAKQAAIAAHWTLERVQQPFVGRLPGFIGGIEVTSHGGRRSDFDSRAVLRSIELTQETVLWLALGLDVADVVHFWRLAGHAYFTMDGQGHCEGTKADIEVAEAEFVMALAIDLAYQVESRVGDIERPFGRDDWH
jgi:hypothetical protein